MTFQSDKFRELERRRKVGEDWDKSLAQVFGYSPEKKAAEKAIPKEKPINQTILEEMVNSVIAEVREEMNVLKKYLSSEVLHVNDKRTKEILIKYENKYNMVECGQDVYSATSGYIGRRIKMKDLSDKYIKYMERKQINFISMRGKEEAYQDIGFFTDQPGDVTWDFIRGRLFAEKQNWDFDSAGIYPITFKVMEELEQDDATRKHDYYILERNIIMLTKCYSNDNDHRSSYYFPSATELAILRVYRKYGFAKINSISSYKTDIIFSLTTFGEKVIFQNNLDDSIQKLKPESSAWI